VDHSGKRVLLWDGGGLVENDDPGVEAQGMSISLIILLWACGSVMLLATSARHDGYVRMYEIYFALAVGPAGLFVGPLDWFFSMLPDSEQIIWEHKE
jgi:hypothetical protein